MFGDDCYWRDILAFTWNIKTMEGRPSIVAMLRDNALRAIAPRAVSASMGEAKVVDGVTEAWFTFETGVARGRGHLRLREVGKAAGRF